MKNLCVKSCLSVVTFFSSLVDTFGARFIAFVVISEMLLQGFVFGGGTGGLVGAPIFFLFRLDGRMSASRMQVLKTIATTPWSLKPLFGVISDVLYMGGYNKMPYIFLTLIGAALSSCVVAAAWPLSPELFTVLLTFIFLSIAVTDLLLEAMYAEKAANRPEITPRLVAFYHMATIVGEVLSIALVASLIVNVPLHYIYLFPVPIFLLALWPVYHNWLGERERVNYLIHCAETQHYRETYDENERNLDNLMCCGLLWFSDRYYYPQSNTLHLKTHESLQPIPTPMLGYDRNKLMKGGRLFSLALIIAGFSLGVGLVALLHLPSLYLFILAVWASLSVCVAFLMLIDSMTAKVVCYVMLHSMFTISHESASFLFYTDSPEQFPAGPHFSVYFYVTVMGLVGCAVAISSTWLYNILLSGWRYRSVFLFGNVLYILVSLLNIVFYRRLNVAWGVPDYLFVLGSESLQIITGMWVMLPASNMMIKLCPRGVEATMYALLAGAANLGRTLSHYQSAYIMDSLNITPTGGPHDESERFENLWLASLISSVLACLPLLFIPLLIPDALQTEQLVDRVQSTIFSLQPSGESIEHSDEFQSDSISVSDLLQEAADDSL